MSEMSEKVAELILRAESRNSPPMDETTALANAERYTLAAEEATTQLYEALNKGDMSRVAERQATVQQMTDLATEAITKVEAIASDSAEDKETRALMEALRKGDMAAVKQHQATLTTLVNGRRSWTR